MKSFEELLTAVESAKVEAGKFDKGNKSAGTRLRKQLQIIARSAKACRQEVSDLKNVGS